MVSGGTSGLLRVQLLGAVRVWQGEEELCLGAPQQKVVLAVLAVLAMRAGLGVSRDELVDAVWDDPPRNAVNSVHIYVAGPREVLEPGRARRAPGRVLVTGGPGYVLGLEPGQVDAAVFGDHLAAARRSRADGDLAAAAGSLDAALGLWQGSPLAGLGGSWAQIERVRLNEARLAAAEDRAEVMLGQGCHDELVSELTGPTAADGAAASAIGGNLLSRGLPQVRNDTRWRLLRTKAFSGFYGAATLTGVSCVCPAWCMAVDRRGCASRWPRYGAAADAARTRGLEDTFTSVACISRSSCVAVRSCLGKARLWSVQRWT